MLGLFSQHGGRPSPASFCARLLIASLLVVWPLRALESRILGPLLPVCGTVLRLLDDRFVLEHAEVVPKDSEYVLRFGANLAAPVTLGIKTIYPFGWIA